jgi:predicted nucleic acid-binding protein
MKRPGLVVCDSSPLIILAKLDCLGLIKQVLGKKIHVLSCEIDEIFQKRIDSPELEYLQVFINEIQVIEFEKPTTSSNKLSTTDLASLNYCVESKAHMLLVDERLLRRSARENGIKVIGSLGILIASKTTGIHSKKWVKKKIDDAISDHDLRISIELYLEIVKALG